YTAGQVGIPPVLARGGVPGDGVVSLAPPPGRHLEAVADLDRLDGLDAHQGLGQLAVQLAVPVDVAAQPDRHAVAQHFHHPAQRVAQLGRRFDLLDHGRLRVGIEAAHVALVDPAEIAGA